MCPKGYYYHVSLCVGVPYMRELDEVWWREGRKEEGEPSQDELNQFMGFSQVFKMIVESVSSTMIRSILCIYYGPVCLHIHESTSV